MQWLGTIQPPDTLFAPISDMYAPARLQAVWNDTSPTTQAMTLGSFLRFCCMCCPRDLTPGWKLWFASAVMNQTILPYGYPPTPLPNFTIPVFLSSVTNAARSRTANYMLVTIVPDPATLLPSRQPALGPPHMSPIKPFTILEPPPLCTITPHDATPVVIRYRIYNSESAGHVPVGCDDVTEVSTEYTAAFTVPAGLTHVCARAYALDGRVSFQVRGCCAPVETCLTPLAFMVPCLCVWTERGRVQLRRGRAHLRCSQRERCRPLHGQRDFRHCVHCRCQRALGCGQYNAAFVAKALEAVWSKLDARRPAHQPIHDH
jgi:hypothetical protein